MVPKEMKFNQENPNNPSPYHFLILHAEIDM